MAKNMPLKNQFLLVNICIVAGLILEYYRGAPILAILITGIFLLLLVNIIFFIRFKRTKRAS